jgi:hypothetical protein
LKRTRTAVVAAAGVVAAFGPARLAGAAPVLSATGPGSGPVVPAVGLAPALPRGALDEGALNPTRTVRVEVILSPSNPSGEATLAADLYDPASPLYHHWLSPAGFDAEFAPAPGVVAETEAWLRSRGLEPQVESPFSLEVSAPAGRVEAALGTRLDSYRVAGTEGYAARGAPLVPSVLERSLTGILGLSSFSEPRPHSSAAGPNGDRLAAARAGQRGPVATGLGGSRPAPAAPARPETASAGPAPRVESAGLPAACPAATAAGSGSGYTMAEEGAQLGVDSLLEDGLTGAGQTIGVFELAGFQASDILTYESCFGLSNPVSQVNVDGGGAPDYLNGGTAEADLDIEQAITQAPGVSVIAYDAPNDGNPSTLYDLWSTIVDQDRAQSVSSSWGACEADSDVGASLDDLFEQAALQGQSVFAASGDSGSEDCAPGYLPLPANPPAGWGALAVDYPGSSPWVTAVGGTDLGSAGQLTVWNYCQGEAGPACFAQNDGYVAGGGGQSSQETSAPWQAAYLRRASGRGPCSTCREVPDVAADAGYPLVSFATDDNNPSQTTEPSWQLGVGTSYAAPFLAGLTADRNQGCQTTTGSFAALAYSLAGQGSSAYAADFHDVVAGDNGFAVGDNDVTGTNGGRWAAAPGYDMDTGLGVPVPAAIACPEVESVSLPGTATPLSGAGSGTTVQVNGLGLGSASIYFGGALAATVPGTATATSVEVVVPVGRGPVTVFGSLDGVGGTQTVGDFTIGAPVGPTGQQCAAATGQPLAGAVAIASVSIDGCPGYFVTDAQGRVAAFGSATTHGDMSGVHLAQPVVGIAATPSGEGYWLVAADGGVFSFGDAGFYGSAVPYHPAAPVVGMASTGTGRGYWLVGADGGVFSFGDAGFYGSAVPYHPVKPVVGIAAAPGGQGYWLVAADGGVFTFTPYGFHGSMADVSLARPVVGMVATPDGQGYTMVAADGGVFTLGDARFFGSQAPDPPPGGMAGIAVVSPDGGYWLVADFGGIYAFGAAPPFGSA